MTDPSQNRKKKKITIIASLQGVERAENALKRLEFDSKSNFAQSKLLARNTVTKFFQRQPIQLDSFKRICEELTLEWREIAEFSSSEEQSERIERKYSSCLETNEEVGEMQRLHRKVTVIDKQSKIIKAVIVLEGDINSVNNDLSITLELCLQRYSGDTITITDIQKGSIRLIVEGSQEDIDRLVSRVKLGKLTEVNGFPVEDVQILSEISEDDENNELDDKWRLVQEIVSQPVKRRKLIGADLSDADLSGADLSDADLNGADLSGADLSGADLSGADLSGADLSGANLSGAIIDSRTKLDDVSIPVEDVHRVTGETLYHNENRAQDGAVFRSGSQNLILRHNPLSVKLIFANLIRGKLGGAFRILINLLSANLSCADLRGVYLRGANLSRADLRCANLRGANLRGANLSRADLRGANLSGANLRGADLSRADLSRAYLIDAYLSGADLNCANLSGAYLIDANLSHANLSGAYLSGADLRGANLRGANLSGANLRGVYLRGADLSGADLSGAYLNCANLSGAYLIDANLSLAYLKGAIINEETRIDRKWRLIWEIVNQGAVDRDLSNANLSDANLRNADLRNADLRGTNLSGANLIYANLIYANLSGADLSSAIVVNALFGGSKGLTDDTKRDLKQRGAIFGDEQRETIFSDRPRVPSPK